MSRTDVVNLLYIVAFVLFVEGLRRLRGPRTAVQGNQIAAVGMAIAVAATLLRPGVGDWALIVVGLAIGTAIGIPSARSVKMTAMPQMVALFNGVGGGAVALISLVEYREALEDGGGNPALDELVPILFAAIVGSISFWGSIVAFGKLQESLKGRFKVPRAVNAALAGLALALVVAIALSGAGRRAVLRGAALTSALVLVLAPGVAYDLVERQRSFGGTQGYEAYLSAKVNLGPVAGDLTFVFSALALLALALALRDTRKDRALIAPLCLLGVTVLLAYGWLLHVPLPYFRMAYFLPVALVPLVAVALTRLLEPRRAALAGAVACAAIAVFAWVQTSNVRDFYAFANRASLRGLDAVAADLRPDEVVVTDRCWSFLTTWLLHTPTIAALEPEDIQPRAELPRARQAREVLDGTPEGLALARRLGVRYLIVDPTCTDTRERPTRPPEVGTPVFLSKRLVVLRLGDE